MVPEPPPSSRSLDPEGRRGGLLDLVDGAGNSTLALGSVTLGRPAAWVVTLAAVEGQCTGLLAPGRPVVAALALLTAAELVRSWPRGLTGAPAALRGLLFVAALWVGRSWGLLSLSPLLLFLVFPRRTSATPSPDVARPGLPFSISVTGAMVAAGAAAGLAGSAKIVALLLSGVEPELGVWAGLYVRELLAWAGVGVLLTLGRAAASRAERAALSAGLGLLVVLAALDGLAAGVTGQRVGPPLVRQVLLHLDQYGRVIQASVAPWHLVVLLVAGALPGLAAARVTPLSPRAGRWALGIMLAMTLMEPLVLTRLPPAPRGLGPPVWRWLARDDALHLDLGVATAPPPTLTAPTDPPPHLVIVSLESVRLRSTTLGDPDLLTTPTLARLAREGWLLSEMRAVIPHTTKALTTMMCGLVASPAPSLPETLDGALAGRCLPALLGTIGYRSQLVFNAPQHFERRGSLALNMGFDRFAALPDIAAPDTPLIGYFGGPDHNLIAPALSWVLAQDQPTLTLLVPVGSHHDYQLPPDWKMLDFPASRPDEARYLNTLRLTDQLIDDLIVAWRGAGLLDDTVFVFIGDHGEAFFEHGLSAHDWVVYEEGLRVPAVIWGPPLGTQAMTLSHPSTQLDLLPTLLGMIGAAVEGHLDGDDLRALSPGAPRAPQLFSCWPMSSCGAVLEPDGTKYVELGDTEDQLRFDLNTDPLELRPEPVPPEARAVRAGAIRLWQTQAASRLVAGAAAGFRARWTPAPAGSEAWPSVAGLGIGACVRHDDGTPGSTAFVRCPMVTREATTLPVSLDWQVGAERGRVEVGEAAAGDRVEAGQAMEVRWVVEVPVGGATLNLRDPREILDGAPLDTGLRLERAEPG